MQASLAHCSALCALPRATAPSRSSLPVLKTMQRAPAVACALRLGGAANPLAPAAAAPRRSAPRRACRSAGAMSVRAMVNVDVSPSVVLGVGLIGAGVSLWQIRRVKPWLSKDYDVVVSCISLLVGGILIFQGWRLDPLLLFGQLMTTGAAVSFAVEALRLRNEVYEGEEKAALQDVLRRNGGPDGGSTGGSFQLPPPEAAQQPWTASSPDQQQQPWADQQAWVPSGTQQPQQGGAYGYSPYDSMQQQQQPAAWGDTAPQQWDYQSGGPIQPAEYEPYSDAGAAGADFFSIGSSGTGGAAPPSEFTFPASYEDGGAAAQQEGSSTWGGSGQQQQGQQQRGQGGSTQRRGGSNFDGMDDW
ncbi:hypothetical protein ABPG77_009121 [Micractinium sp. CCAP 211/92]